MPSSAPEPLPAPSHRTNVILFACTVVSVFVTAAAGDKEPLFSRAALLHGGQFTAALLAILVAHELGHFVASRIHRVEASLPYFIPLPFLSPFGTMGAVIRMRGTITTRRALLDIGASGPLAGLAVALPMYVWGVSHSRLVAASQEGMVELGESIALKLLDRYSAPTIPVGMELELSPVAFAAWAGLFITMINLLPVGQLDGGHVAYSLFGPRQDTIARNVHRATLVFFFVNVIGFWSRDLQAGLRFEHLGRHVGNSVFWLVWFEMLAILGSLSRRANDERRPPERLSARTRAIATLGLVGLASVGQKQSSPVYWVVWFAALAGLLVMEWRVGCLSKHDLFDHPPTGAEPLGLGRAAVAVITLVVFALLFMPTPIAM